MAPRCTARISCYDAYTAASVILGLFNSFVQPIGKGRVMRRTDGLGGRVRQACELATLEARRMLAATLDGRLWGVEGERIDDSIVIEADPLRAGRVRAVVNGVAIASVNVKEIDTIHVSGGDGADRVLVKLGDRFAGLRVRADGNAGDDT